MWNPSDENKISHSLFVYEKEYEGRYKNLLPSNPPVIKRRQSGVQFSTLNSLISNQRSNFYN